MEQGGGRFSLGREPIWRNPAFQDRYLDGHVAEPGFFLFFFVVGGGGGGGGGVCFCCVFFFALVFFFSFCLFFLFLFLFLFFFFSFSHPWVFHSKQRVLLGFVPSFPLLLSVLRL